MIEVQVGGRSGGRRCVYCREALSAALALVDCSACGVVVHAECARELRRCPTLGCGAVFAAPSASADAPAARRRFGPPAVAGAVGLLAAGLVAAGALWTPSETGAGSGSAAAEPAAGGAVSEGDLAGAAAALRAEGAARSDAEARLLAAGGAAVPALLDEATRRPASVEVVVDLLAGMGPPARRAVLAALRDDEAMREAGRRRASLGALERLGLGPDGAPALAGLFLATGDLDERRRLLALLGTTGPAGERSFVLGLPPAGVRLLHSIASGASPELRAQLERLFAAALRIAPEAAGRHAAVEGLVALAPSADHVQELLVAQLAADEDAGVRALVVRSLGLARGDAAPDARAALRRSASDDPAVVVRRAALEVLRGWLGRLARSQRRDLALEPSEVEAVRWSLVQALDDPEERVRAEAADLLDDLGAPGPPLGAAEAGALAAALRLPDVRDRARDVLLEVTPEAGPILVGALGDPDVEVRRIATRLLELAAPAVPGAGGALVRVLEDPDAVVRRHAASALGSYGEAAPMAGLVAALETGGPEARAAAIDAVSDLGPAARSACDALGRLVGGPDADLARSAVHALHRVGPEGPVAVEALVRLAVSPDHRLLVAAGDALRRLAESPERPFAESLAPVARALPMWDRRQAWEGLRLLQDLGPRARCLLPALGGRLDDRDRDVRREVALTLAAVAPDEPRAAELLTEALARAEPKDVRHLARAVGALDDAVALPALLDLLEGPPRARARAADLLRRSRAALADGDLDALARHLAGAEQTGDGMDLAALLRRQGAPGALRLLEVLLGGGDVGRGCAASGLYDVEWARIDAETARFAARTLAARVLREEVRGIQDRLFHVLARVGREAVGPLRELLQVREVRLRRATAQVLGQLEEVAAAAAPDLERLLAEEDEGRDAAEALWRLGPAGVAALRRALRSGSGRAPERAAAALGRVTGDRALLAAILHDLRAALPGATDHRFRREVEAALWAVERRLEGLGDG